MEKHLLAVLDVLDRWLSLFLPPHCTCLRLCQHIEFIIPKGFAPQFEISCNERSFALFNFTPSFAGTDMVEPMKGKLNQVFFFIGRPGSKGQRWRFAQDANALEVVLTLLPRFDGIHLIARYLFCYSSTLFFERTHLLAK